MKVRGSRRGSGGRPDKVLTLLARTGAPVDSRAAPQVGRQSVVWVDPERASGHPAPARALNSSSGALLL